MCLSGHYAGLTYRLFNCIMTVSMQDQPPSGGLMIATAVMAGVVIRITIRVVVELSG